MKVGIQGIQGSFNEVAAKELAPDAIIVYLVSSAAVLQALHQGEIDLGVCATENSMGGIVHETKVALEQYPATEIKRTVMPIHQCLIASNEMPFYQITEVHSHPQALKQCAEFLKHHCPNARLVEEEDTAICAQRLAAGEYPDTAAMIGNQACVEIYGLTLLKASVQDRDDNRTTFVLFGV